MASRVTAPTLPAAIGGPLSTRLRHATGDSQHPGRSSDAGLARQYSRYGYQRIHDFLAHRGFEMSAERAYRLWRPVQLHAPRRRPWRRIDSGRPSPERSNAVNHVWANDFIYDHRATGQQLKCSTVAKERTRQHGTIEVSESIRFPLGNRPPPASHHRPPRAWVPPFSRRTRVRLAGDPEVIGWRQHRNRSRGSRSCHQTSLPSRSRTTSEFYNRAYQS